MKIAIIGSGIVGKGTGAGFQQLGHDVVYYDINPDKLKELRNCQTTEKLEEAINYANMSFICVPTPYKNGIDLSYLREAIANIAEILKDKKDWHLVVIKSTVIPLTCDNVVKPILDTCGKPYGLCMNPEFLTEISTTWTDDVKFKRDFWCKERIVIGEKDKRSGDMLASLYQPLNAPIFRVDLKTAEMTKYATNMMLATKISYWNEIFLVCKELNIDSKVVADITSLDNRIGKYGTIHGLAHGGKCLAKDIKAFTHAFRTEQSNDLKQYLIYPSVLNEADAINDFMEANYGVRE